MEIVDSLKSWDDYHILFSSVNLFHNIIKFSILLQKNMGMTHIYIISGREMSCQRIITIIITIGYDAKKGKNYGLVKSFNRIIINMNCLIKSISIDYVIFKLIFLQLTIYISFIYWIINNISCFSFWYIYFSHEEITVYFSNKGHSAHFGLGPQ